MKRQSQISRASNAQYATINIADESEPHQYKMKMENGGFTYAYNAVNVDEYNTSDYAYGTRLTEAPLI